MSYIIEGVYLGSLDEAWKPEKLKENGVTHILTIESKPLPLEVHTGFQYKYVHALDMEETDILSHLQECLEFMEEGRKSGAVFVHCYAGQSRSSTLVIAHVMCRLDMGLDDAVKLVRCQKGDIKPNSGFHEQLRLFEDMGNKIDPSHQGFKLFKLQNLSRNMQCAYAQSDSLAGSLTADPSLAPATGGVAYKCRKCRRLLFKQDGVLQHEEGQGEVMFRYKSHSPGGTRAGTGKTCDKSLFIEPVQWMADFILEIHGKIGCPKCSAKLGSYNWAGERCPCGTWVTPAFHIQNGKVDQVRARVAPPVINVRPRLVQKQTTEKTSPSSSGDNQTSSNPASGDISDSGKLVNSNDVTHNVAGVTCDVKSLSLDS